jgi:hypothetical protein
MTGLPLLCCTLAALVLAPFHPFPAADAGAQTISANSVAAWIGQRIIMLHGMGAVYEPGKGPEARTEVGINLVMPVHRIEGRKVWVVSTSGGDSGWVDVGRVRLLTGSIAYFDSLITADSRDWDAYLRRAEAEHALNARDASTADYSKAIGLHPDEAFLYLRRGRHYNTLRECAKEVEDFDSAIRLAPTSAPQDYNFVAEVTSLKAGVYFACPDTTFRDYARGVALAKQAADADPSRATLVTILAAAYAQSGDYANAVRTQRQALARPDFPPAYRAENERTLARYVAAAAARSP